jgi:hypothetical protein
MMNNPAVTVPGAHRMDISAEWIEKHPDDWGMVIHELTHTLQAFNLKKTKHVGWLTEGIADYVRDFEFEPEKRLPLSPNKTYRDGYRTAATFLNWAAQTYDARLIEKLQAQLEADTYTDDLFMEITGRPLDRGLKGLEDKPRPGKEPLLHSDWERPRPGHVFVWRARRQRRLDFRRRRTEDHVAGVPFGPFYRTFDK